MDNNKQRSYGSLGVGLFLLAAGVALMLDKLDIFYVGSVWHLWPLIFIAMGLGKLLDAQFACEYRKGIWFLFLGGWFLVSELHILGLGYHNSWPILLIGVGIGMLWKTVYPPDYRIVKDQCHGH